MAKILFYGAFQTLVGQPFIEKDVSVPCLLSHVFSQLFTRYPDLKAALLVPGTEKIRPEVLLLQNGKPVKRDIEGVTVHPDDEITVMHQISGGNRHGIKDLTR